MLNFENDDIYTIIPVDVDSENSIQKYNIEAALEFPVCPKCNDASIAKVGKLKTQNIYDIVYGVPAQITLTRQKYRCRRCGHTFTAIPLNGPKCSDEFVGQALDEYLHNPESTYSSISKKYGISERGLRRRSAEVVNELTNKSIFGDTCWRLRIDPFEYGGTRCLISGIIDSIDDYNAALAILADYSAESVKSFLQNNLKKRDYVVACFCPLDPDIVSVVQNELTNCEIVIPIKSVKSHIRSISCPDEMNYTKFSSEFGSLLKIVDLPHGEMIHALCHESFESIDLQLIAENILALSGCIKNAEEYEPEEYDVHRLLALINKLRSKRLPFEVMVAKLLYISQSAHYSGKGSVNIYTEKYIYDHYVSILNLLEEFE